MSIGYFDARGVSPRDYAQYQLPHYLRSRLPKNADACLIDYGCGFGQIMLALKKIGYLNVNGIDVDEKAIAHCRAVGLNILRPDIADLNAYMGICDFVIMSHVLEHIPKEKIIPILKSVRELLKPSGELMIMVPNAQSVTGCYWAYEDFTHTTLFTCGSISYVLRMAGFGKIQIIDIDATAGLSFLNRLLRKSFYFGYNLWASILNKMLGSSFHSGGLQCFSYEVKVIAAK